MIPVVRRAAPRPTGEASGSSAVVTARGLGRVPAPTWQWPGALDVLQRIRLSGEWRTVFRASDNTTEYRGYSVRLTTIKRIVMHIKNKSVLNMKKRKERNKMQEL
jgi:hypothetical protein